MIKKLYKKNKKIFISGFIGLLIILIIVGNIFRDDSEVINVVTEKIGRQTTSVKSDCHIAMIRIQQETFSSE